MRLLLSSLFILSVVILYGQKLPLYKEIENIIAYDADISYDLTPGFVVAIIDNDSTYYLSFGKNAANSDLLSNEDVFELGSISKSFTSALINLLAENKLLSLNQCINDFLPLNYRNPRIKNLTIEDLLNHQSFFPRRPSLFGEKEEDPQNPYEFYSKQDLLEYYSNFVPDKTKEFNYSHTNYALLEVVIENVTHLEFEDALNQYIISPLGMRNSLINFKEKKTNILTPGMDRSLTLANPWQFKSFAGSEGVKSCAKDLVAFLNAFLGVSATPLDNTFPPIISYNHPSFNDRLFYSMGWHAIKINKKIRAVVNNGNTNGHSAFVGMVPENKTAVIVLSNSSFGTKDLGLLILRMINYNWKRKAQ